MDENNIGVQEARKPDRFFIGTYEHSLDVKGRVIVPSIFREQLGDKVVIAKSIESCLSIYPLDEFEKLRDSIRNESSSNKKKRDYIRFFFASAYPCEIDKQGRLMIPPKLRNYAALEKDVCSVGADNIVEIWDKAAFEAAEEALDPSTFSYEEDDDSFLSNLGR